MVKGAVRGSERPNTGLRGQPEGLRVQLEDLEASLRVLETSQGIRWLMGDGGGTEKRGNLETWKRRNERLSSPLCGTIGR